MLVRKKVPVRKTTLDLMSNSSLRALDAVQSASWRTHDDRDQIFMVRTGYVAAAVCLTIGTSCAQPASGLMRAVMTVERDVQLPLERIATDNRGLRKSPTCRSRCALQPRHPWMRNRRFIRGRRAATARTLTRHVVRAASSERSQTSSTGRNRAASRRFSGALAGRSRERACERKPDASATSMTIRSVPTRRPRASSIRSYSRHSCGRRPVEYGHARLGAVHGFAMLTSRRHRQYTAHQPNPAAAPHTVSAATRRAAGIVLAQWRKRSRLKIVSTL